MLQCCLQRGSLKCSRLCFASILRLRCPRVLVWVWCCLGLCLFLWCWIFLFFRLRLLCDRFRWLSRCHWQSGFLQLLCLCLRCRYSFCQGLWWSLHLLCWSCFEECRIHPVLWILCMMLWRSLPLVRSDCFVWWLGFAWFRFSWFVCWGRSCFCRWGSCLCPAVCSCCLFLFLRLFCRGCSGWLLHQCRLGWCRGSTSCRLWLLGSWSCWCFCLKRCFQTSCWWLVCLLCRLLCWGRCCLWKLSLWLCCFEWSFLCKLFVTLCCWCMLRILWHYLVLHLLWGKYCPERGLLLRILLCCLCSFRLCLHWLISRRSLLLLLVLCCLCSFRLCLHWLMSRRCLLLPFQFVRCCCCSFLLCLHGLVRQFQWGNYCPESSLLLHRILRCCCCSFRLCLNQ